MDANQITARIGATNVEYRRQATFQRNISKVDFDTEVYDYYRKHHPIDAAAEMAASPRKDTT